MIPASFILSAILSGAILVLFVLDRKGATGKRPAFRDSLIVLISTYGGIQILATGVSLIVTLWDELGNDGLGFVFAGMFVLSYLPFSEVWNRFRGKNKSKDEEKPRP